jgi:hypothetical protein
VKSSIVSVKQILALHPGLDRFINVIVRIEEDDALSETRSSVLGGLEQARNHRRLENTEESCIYVYFSNFNLVGR